MRQSPRPQTLGMKDKKAHYLSLMPSYDCNYYTRNHLPYFLLRDWWGSTARHPLFLFFREKEFYVASRGGRKGALECWASLVSVQTSVHVLFMVPFPSSARLLWLFSDSLFETLCIDSLDFRVLRQIHLILRLIGFLLKGIDRANMKILSLFTHFHNHIFIQT